jgi:hypothetical protein
MVFFQKTYRQVASNKSRANFSQHFGDQVRTHGTETLQPSFLTIVSTLKPNTNEEIKRRQTNAIFSWANLRPQPTIILFGDEQGTDEIASEVRCKTGAHIIHEPQLHRSEEFHPMPFVDWIFERSRQLCNTSLLMYTNADIMFLDDLLPTLQAVQNHFQSQHFLVVGKRFDSNTPHYVDFNGEHQDPHAIGYPMWEVCFLAHKSFNETDELSVKHQVRSSFQAARSSWIANDVNLKWAIDYFVFTKNFWIDNNIVIPPFLLGVQVFDNWLVHKPNLEMKNVVDASNTVLAVHQSHEFTHMSEKKLKMKEYNIKQAGGMGKWFLGNTGRAKYYTNYCEDSCTSQESCDQTHGLSQICILQRI